MVHDHMFRKLLVELVALQPLQFLVFLLRFRLRFGWHFDIHGARADASSIDFEWSVTSVCPKAFTSSLLPFCWASSPICTSAREPWMAFWRKVDSSAAKLADVNVA